MQQIKSAVIGFAIAPLVLIGAVFLLAWNEGRSVERIRTLAIGEKVVAPGSADMPNAGQDGTLVHVTGELVGDQNVADPTFGLDLPSVALRREVAMYQWVEDETGTGDSRRYTYTREWATDLVDWTEFREPEGHENPGIMPIEGRRVLADRITLGALTLGEAMRGEIDFYVPLELDDASYEAMPAAARRTYQRRGDALEDFTGEPRVGDVRVTFRHVPRGTASGVAMQAAGALHAYPTGHGEIALLGAGTLTAHELFEVARTENAILTWILRVVGIVLVTGAFMGLIRPLTLLGAWIPVLGGVLEAAGFAVALLAGTVTGLGVIAVAWMVVRPILSVGLLALCGGAFVLFAALRRRGGAAASPTVAAATGAAKVGGPRAPARAGPPKTFGRQPAG